EKALDAHPKLPIVVVADEDAMGPILEFRNAMYSADRFAIAGYGAEQKARKMLYSGQCAGVADVNNPRLARRALQTLLESMGGKPAPDRFELETAVTRAKRNDNTFTMPVPKTDTQKL